MLSTVETKPNATPPLDPRAQLAQVEAVSRTTEDAAFLAPRLWFFPVFALCAPAIVWLRAHYSGSSAFRDGELTLLLIGGIAMAIISGVALAIELKRELSHPIRAKSPIRGGRTTPWAFVAILGVNMPLMFALISANDANPYVKGALLFLIIAIVPTYCFRRHQATLGLSLI